jgi:hypothetical protein
MDAIRNNVVPLHRNDMTPEDADAIEMIVRVHSGEEVAIEQMEMTEEPLDSICHRMNAEPEALVSESHGWRFPVMQWRYRNASGGRLVLTVVDQGQRRVFRHRVERR